MVLTAIILDMVDDYTTIKNTRQTFILVLVVTKIFLTTSISWEEMLGELLQI